MIPPRSARTLLLASGLLCTLAAASRPAMALEQIGRAIGIGHGPGYHANNCPWCKPPGRCAPGVMCQNFGGWTASPGVGWGYPGVYAYEYPPGYGTPPGYGYPPGYRPPGGPERAPRPAQPEHVQPPWADDTREPMPPINEPLPSGIELAPGEVLLEPPRDFHSEEADHAARARESDLKRYAAQRDTFPAQSYGVPARSSSSQGAVIGRTIGGQAIGYSPTPAPQRSALQPTRAEPTFVESLSAPKRIQSQPVTVTTPQGSRSRGPVVRDLRSHDADDRREFPPPPQGEGD